jgi:hypothetical protein
MKQLLILFAFVLLLSTEAKAGTITITVRNDANAIIGQPETFTISNANLARLQAWLQSAYPVQVPAVVDGQGNVTTPATTRAPTTAEAIHSWAIGVWRGTIANVQNSERSNAASAASAGVATIPE